MFGFASNFGGSSSDYKDYEDCLDYDEFEAMQHYTPTRRCKCCNSVLAPTTQYSDTSDEYPAIIRDICPECGFDNTSF